MRTTRPLAAIAIAGLLALAGCGDDDDDAGDDIGLAPDTTATTVSTDTTSSTTSSDDAGTQTTTTTGASGTSDTTAGASPIRACETYPEADDGVYPVFDAGEIVISRDGDTITLEQTRPADGWTATDDLEDDADEVEVDFRGNGREIEVEAEIDDGVMEVEVCDD